jgi:MraZ protein
MGNAPATVDDKGRLKLPQAFRALLEPKYGRELYVTSLTGDHVRVYPMPVWTEILQKLAASPSIDPSKSRFLQRVNYYGAAAELDAQGRVLIPFRLRQAAAMTGEVDVLGQSTFLEVWNHDRLETKMSRDGFGDDDLRRIAEFGV